MEGCLVMDSIRRKGGLVLFWKYENAVEVINYSNQHVSVLVKREMEGKDWHFTGFYGQPKTGKIGLSWDLLRQLKPANAAAWCAGRDFNEILWQNEKVGAREDLRVNLKCSKKY